MPWNLGDVVRHNKKAARSKKKSALWVRVSNDYLEKHPDDEGGAIRIANFVVNKSKAFLFETLLPMHAAQSAHVKGLKAQADQHLKALHKLHAIITKDVSRPGVTETYIKSRFVKHPRYGEYNKLRKAYTKALNSHLRAAFEEDISMRKKHPIKSASLAAQMQAIAKEVKLENSPDHEERADQHMERALFHQRRCHRLMKKGDLKRARRHLKKLVDHFNLAQGHDQLRTGRSIASSIQNLQERLNPMSKLTARMQTIATGEKPAKAPAAPAVIANSESPAYNKEEVEFHKYNAKHHATQAKRAKTAAKEAKSPELKKHYTKLAKHHTGLAQEHKEAYERHAEALKKLPKSAKKPKEEKSEEGEHWWKAAAGTKSLTKPDAYSRLAGLHAEATDHLHAAKVAHLRANRHITKAAGEKDKTEKEKHLGHAKEQEKARDEHLKNYRRTHRKIARIHAKYGNFGFASKSKKAKEA
jgi:hypothetical protein